MKSKVSIIIPIYNGEKYLDIIINSILRQTYKNLEVIFVDDESKDNSKKIIEKYKKKYSFFRIVTQKNSGQAAARNNGIRNVTGDFITFADQDDYFNDSYIEELISNIDNNDILITGYNRVDESGKILYSKKPKNVEWSKFKYCSTWGKLYKSSFIKENDLKFGNYKIGEDLYFLMSAISRTSKVKIYEYSGYNNLRNLSSVSNNINKKKGSNVLFPLINDMNDNLDFSNFDKKFVTYFFLKTIVHYIYNQRKNCTLNEYYSLFNEYYDWLIKFYAKYNMKIKFVYQKDEEFKNNLLINLFILFKKIHLIEVLLFLLKKLTPNTNK